MVAAQDTFSDNKKIAWSYNKKTEFFLHFCENFPYFLRMDKKLQKKIN